MTGNYLECNKYVGSMIEFFSLQKDQIRSPIVQLLFSPFRRQFNVHAQDIIGNCLGYLYTRHDSNDLVQQFRAIQAKSERLESTGKI